MADRPRNVFLCSCESTMPLDLDTVRRACPGMNIGRADQLCRAEFERFRAAVETGAPLTIGCTQEAPLFGTTAQESGRGANISFVNVRETAGWSAQAENAGPK